MNNPKIYAVKVSQVSETEIDIEKELINTTDVFFYFKCGTAGTFYLKSISDIEIFGEYVTVSAWSANTPDIAYAYGGVNKPTQFEFHLQSSKGEPMPQIPANTILQFTIFT